MKCSTSSNHKAKKKCNAKSECPCVPGSKKSIAEIIKCYLSDTRGLMKEKGYYSSLTTKQAINNAGLALSIWSSEQEEARKHPHQYRRKSAALEIVRKALLAKEKEILSCTKFDVLHEKVKRTIEKIEDIGALMIYDTALRIGMNIGVAPEKVYLHSGTLEGAKAVLPVGRRKVLCVSELPKEFYGLDADSVENCLCICKEQLKSLGPQ